MIKHYSYKLQNVIQKELFAAKHSIKVCMAWITNDLLFQPLLLKLDAGVVVAIITNKDEINFGENNDVDFDEFIQRGGCIYWNVKGDTGKLLHHKFCIIDNSVVISGSYNWTKGAEHNNEDITIYTDEQETIKHYSEIFDKIAAKLPKSIGEIQRAEQKEEVILDLPQQLQARYCEIGEYIDGLARVCRTTGSSHLWGFVDEQGEEVIPCRYNSVAEFNNGLSFVCLGHYFGAIDKNGTEIISFQHKTIRWRDNNFIEAYLGNDELCIYDNSGVRIDSNRIIVYTTADGTVIDRYHTTASVLSNTYINGKGLLIFDKPNNYIRNKAPYRVTSIEDGAFSGCSSLTSINITNSVTYIGSRAFSGCSSLRSINIPNGVTIIGKYAFSDCSSLTSINIPNGVTRIEEYAFIGCSGLTSITIPNTVTTIGEWAFNGCTGEIIIDCNIPSASLSSYQYGVFYNSKFTKLTIGSSVTEIGNYAFYSHDSLKIVTIGDRVTMIGESAFFGCSSVTSVTIGESVRTIGGGAFFGCSSLKSVTIPNSVTTIGESAFFGCSSVTSVTIGESVRTIGGGAFSKCTCLNEFRGRYAADNGRCLIKNNTIIAYAQASGTTYTIPNSVVLIGEWAFQSCDSLISVDIHNGVTTIGRWAFSGCSSLRSINIPNRVTRIEDGAFSGCSSLTSITIPDNVTSIGNDAFSGCTGILIVNCNIPNATSDSFGFFHGSEFTKVSIGDSVTSIGDYAFDFCRSLTEVNIGNGVTTIGNRAFGNCTSLTSITIPDSVIAIGQSAFEYCRSLTSVTISNSVTEIGDCTFVGCSSLTNITIPDSVIAIGKSAFYGCENLTSITIPDSITTIGMRAFYSHDRSNSVTIIGDSVPLTGEYTYSPCNSMINVYCKSKTPPMGYDMFDNNNKYCKIYVHMKSVDAYKSAEGWNKYSDQIVGYDFENGVVVK